MVNEVKTQEFPLTYKPSGSQEVIDSGTITLKYNFVPMYKQHDRAFNNTRDDNQAGEFN